MSTIRLFIAIELPAEIQEQLDQVSRQLKQRLQMLPSNAVRWVAAKNIHLTLKFLGEVSVSNLDMLQEALLAEAAGHKPLEFSVGGLGGFPSLQRPRVVWVGVEAPAELGAVQVGLDHRLARLGYAPEERPFSPHLTLGRVGRGISTQDQRQLGEVLQASHVGFLGAAPARAVKLFKSDLKPGGAVYTCLVTAPFTGETKS
jgi:RNA 2',3'-cyclic 3'-phosphodiesterase